MFQRFPKQKKGPASMPLLAFWVIVYKLILKAEDLIYLPFNDRKHEGIMYPSMAKRFLAAFVDIIVVVTLIVLVISALGLRWIGLSPESHVIIGAFMILILPPTLTTLVTIKYKGTIGKIVFKMTMVSSRTGEGLPWGNALLREVSKWLFLPIWPFLFFLSLLSRKNRSIHDIIASTSIVINEKNEEQ